MPPRSFNAPNPIRVQANSGIEIGKIEYDGVVRPQTLKLVWTYQPYSPANFEFLLWKVNHGPPHKYIFVRDVVTTKSPTPSDQSFYLKLDPSTIKGLEDGGHYKPVLVKTVTPVPTGTYIDYAYAVGDTSFVYQV